MMRRAGHFIQAAVIRFLMLVSRVMPLPWRAKTFGTLARLALLWVPPLRRRAMDNLDLIYPDMPPREKSKILREVGFNVGRTLCEIFFSAEYAQQIHTFDITGPGMKMLRTLSDNHHGAIIVTGHFGQWEAVRHTLKAHNMETGAIYRPNNNPYYEPIFRQGIEVAGMPIVPRGASGMRQMLKHIRAGGFMAFLCDQYVQDDTVLTFLDQPAATTLSPAKLALRHNVPLVPVIGLRRGDRVEVFIGDPIPTATAEAMMQSFNDFIESYIRAYPGQWHWLHDRWKMGKWQNQGSQDT